MYVRARNGIILTIAEKLTTIDDSKIGPLCQAISKVEIIYAKVCQEAPTMEDNHELSVQVGRRIRALRLSQEITVEALAEAADISVQYVSEIERGKKNMTIPILRNLVRALHTSSDYLLFGRSEVDPLCDTVARRLGDLLPVERELVANGLLKMAQVVEGMGLEK